MFFNILTALILLSAVVDDLRSRKIHNWLILVLFALAFLAVVILRGPEGILHSLKGLFIALGIAVPLALLKILGGGDMKLYAVLGLLLSPRALILSLLWGFVWGAVLGVIKVVLDKKAGLMYVNLLSICRFQKTDKKALHSFPFSVSLFLGWLSSFYSLSGNWGF